MMRRVPAIKTFLLKQYMRCLSRKKQHRSLPDRVTYIALWQLGGVGDMLLATPVIRALNTKYPDAQIDVWCSHPQFAIFLTRFPHVVIKPAFAVYAFDARTLWRKSTRDKLKAILADMSVQPYDLLINLHVPALLDWWAVEWWLVKKIAPIYALGFDPDGVRDASIFDVSLPATLRKTQHYTHVYQALLHKAAIEADTTTCFPIQACERDVVAGLLQTAHVNAQAKLVCMHIGGRRLMMENKMWPIAAFAQVAKAKIEEGLVPVLIGVKAEADMGQALMQQVDGVMNLIGLTSLGEMAALIGQSAVFVGHDSGPFHIAVACGTPAVAICGRPDAEPEYLAYQRSDVVVLTADSPQMIDEDAVCHAMMQVMKSEEGQG